MRPGIPRYLVLEHEIVTLPSASVLAWSRRSRNGRASAPGKLAILADPIFGEKKSTWGYSGIEQVFTPLPGTRREALAIARLVPPAFRFLALGAKASRQTATRPDLARYRILHFATHGLLEELPDRSGLVLSMLDEQGQLQDGFLRAREIYSLHLPAELVVLSACETGVSSLTEQSDLSGLSRAFLHAGAARVMVSLWKVQDRSTPALMERFYRELLLASRTPAAALREAQLYMILDSPWKDPYHWAAFVLQGEWQ